MPHKETKSANVHARLGGRPGRSLCVYDYLTVVLLRRWECTHCSVAYAVCGFVCMEAGKIQLEVGGLIFGVGDCPKKGLTLKNVNITINYEPRFQKAVGEK